MRDDKHKPSDIQQITLAKSLFIITGNAVYVADETMQP
jgi:hypothetical protein